VIPGTVLHPEPPTYVLPVSGYRLTGRFGARSGYWSTVHTGLDFAAPAGTPIRSIGDGVVSSTGYDGRYGTKTVVTLKNGAQIWYCHQDSTSVAVGQRVRVGEVIGTVGTTGNVTGSHLHLEVRTASGRPVDPLSWMRSRGIRA
jgi:murein DD-endopeptidase MepM/ murein hydrolase activator NlpD